MSGRDDDPQRPKPPVERPEALRLRIEEQIANGLQPVHCATGIAGDLGMAKRVLIVGSISTLAVFYERLRFYRRVAACCAANLHEARRLLVQEPDLVVIDLRLAGAEGVQLLAELSSRRMKPWVVAVVPQLEAPLQLRPWLTVAQRPRTAEAAESLLFNALAESNQDPCDLTLRELLEIVKLAHVDCILRVKERAIARPPTFGLDRMPLSETCPTPPPDVYAPEPFDIVRFGLDFQATPMPSTTQTTRDRRVIELLYRWSVPPRRQLERLGPWAPAALARVTRNPRVDIALRTRAFEALRQFPEESIKLCRVFAQVTVVGGNAWSVDTGPNDTVETLSQVIDDREYTFIALPLEKKPVGNPVAFTEDGITPSFSQVPAAQFVDAVSLVPFEPPTSEMMLAQMTPWPEGSTSKAPEVPPAPVPFGSAELIGERTPSPVAPVEPPLDAEQIAFNVVLDEAVEALLGRAYGLAWQHLKAAERLRPDSGIVRANLARIRQMGHAPPEDD